jgi:hypothetical protein
MSVAGWRDIRGVELRGVRPMPTSFCGGRPEALRWPGRLRRTPHATFYVTIDQLYDATSSFQQRPRSTGLVFGSKQGANKCATSAG